MSVEHWEQYYRTGALVSCPMGPGGGYTLELADLWRSFFGALPDGARVLDIGTGNGAIALLAKDAAAAAGKSFEIHGTDLALIDPPAHVRDGARRLAGIRFHAQTPTESLPFDDGSVDAVSGQYALEYTDLPRALAEIARVLKPGAPACFVLHHVDSVMAANARESLQHVELVLNRTKVFRRLRRFLEAEPRSPSAARSAWQDLGAAVSTLRQAAQQAHSALTLNVTIDAVTKLVDARHQLGLAQARRTADEVEDGIRASVHRLRDLVDAAQTPEGIATIAAQARAAGFATAEPAPQHHAETHLVGWRLDLTRAA